MTKVEKLIPLVEAALKLAADFEKETNTKLESIDFFPKNLEAGKFNPTKEPWPVILWGEETMANDIKRPVVNGRSI